MRALDELDAAYARYRVDPDFIAELDSELAHFVGRPSPIYHAKRWSDELGGAQIWLKREDLNHTGAHKINNTIGQALLARADGQAARDRRDRRGPARRRDGDGGGALRHGMRRLHGQRGRRAAVGQRAFA